MPKLGAMVIGQSPRHDIEAEIRAATGDDMDIDLRGALDGLDRQQIDAIPPQSDADTLFTRLPSGDAVTISKKAVMAHGGRQLERLIDAGYDVTMILCTGDFPGWSERFRVVYPSRVLRNLVTALQPDGPIGVFTPLPEQAAKTEARWRDAGLTPTVVPLSPNADGAAVETAARRLAPAQPTLLVFDCISYTSQAKRRACETLATRGVLAITAAARAAAELAS